MSGADEVRGEMLKATRKVALDYGRVEFDALARKVVHRLRRFPASGIYGDDYRHKTLWDEYCHEAEHGPHEWLEDAWSQTLAPFLSDVIDRIPRHAAMLLSVYAAYMRSEVDEAEVIGTVWHEGVREALSTNLSWQAKEAVKRDEW